MIFFLQDSLGFLADNPNKQLGVFNDGTTANEWRRLPRLEEEYKRKGKDRRNEIKETLYSNSLKRPLYSTSAK